MKIRSTIFATLAAFAIAASPALAGPGGNGNGNGNGAANGNGGNSADAGAASSAGGNGHGQETSTAAKDPATSGLDKALAVVGTTPASQKATDAITAAISRILGQEADELTTE
jgi:hypothetical protein